MTPDLPATLARLEAWLAANVPTIQASLRPGASEAEIASLEAQLGVRLPEAFHMLYQWHDGQEGEGDGVGAALGLGFLPLTSVERRWKSWQRVGELYPELNSERPSLSHPNGAIQDAYTTPGWIGFLEDTGANAVGLDFNPGPKGKVGQIITFGRDEEKKFVLADTLEGFLGQYLERLEAGAVTVSDVGYGMFEVRLHHKGTWPGGVVNSYPGFSPEWERRQTQR